MKVTLEPFTPELFAELLPLAQRSWDESTKIKGPTCAFYGERDFNIEPNVDQYQKVQDVGALAIFVLRDEGKAVGYLVSVFYQTWHHRSILGVTVDCSYVEPEHRAHFWVLAKAFEKEARRRGAGIIGWPTHVDGPLFEILKSKGYVGDDLVMEKRLKPCVLQQPS